MHANKAKLADIILQYMDWLPMNPETNSVAKLYMKQVHDFIFFVKHLLLAL
jgi:hypothetical protein